MPGDTAADVAPGEAFTREASTEKPALPPKIAGGDTAALPSETGVLRELPEGERVRVQTEVYDITFTSLGAAPVSWKLTQYPREKCFKYRVNIAWPPIEKDPECDTRPVELIDPGFKGTNHPLVAEVRLGGDKVPLDAEWDIETSDLQVTEGETASLVFTKELPGGGALKKIFRFTGAAYHTDLLFKVEGRELRSAAVDLALFYQWTKYTKDRVPRWNFNGPEAHDGQVLKKMDPDDVVDQGHVARQNVDWAGFTGDYFLNAVLSRQGEHTIDYVVQFLGSVEDKESRKAPKEMVGWVRTRPMEDDLEKNIAANLTLFMGPKDKRILRSVRESLVYSIDYGRLRILVEPLIFLLYWINKVPHNYGVSIIILTVAIRMLLFPLTRTSQKSMKQMQKLQPEIKKIREQYPDDKGKQQEEMQALWRKYKVNPAMGCLPLLLQFPVFFAFYKALLISIELRQAPFFGWIIDLSARDPLYIWPVAMGATQLVTQKLTPTQVDPTQQKIFMIMPIVFMYILRDFPAGLLIYWTVQNLVGIAQQVYVNKKPD